MDSSENNLPVEEVKTGFKGFLPYEQSSESQEVTDISENISGTECNVKALNVDELGPPLLDSTYTTNRFSCDDARGLDLMQRTDDYKLWFGEITGEAHKLEKRNENQKTTLKIDANTKMEPATLKRDNIIDCHDTKDNYIIPDVKKTSSHVLPPISLVEEVTKKVDHLDLIEKPSITTASSVIVKNQSSSLRNIFNYYSDSSDSEGESVSDVNMQNTVFLSSSTSSDSELDSRECVEISDSDDDDNIEFVIPNCKNLMKKDVSVHESAQWPTLLPPLDLSTLQIDYENEHFVHIGKISNFVSNTVTIEALEKTDPYNIETVLFIEDKLLKKPLGRITDVIGPVSLPVYCVELQDPKDVEKLGLKQGAKVYSAPRSQYTKYVFVKDLLRMKGTDASWVGDQEPPSSEDDSSEDESEKKEVGSRKRSHNNSLERHQRFENAKNRSNTFKNRLTHLIDNSTGKPRLQNIHMFPHGFDPSIPPPLEALTPPPPQRFTSQVPPHFYQSAVRQPWQQQYRFTPRNHQGFHQNHANYSGNNRGYNYNSAGPSHWQY